MKLTIRLFGPLAERAGKQTIEVELPDGAMVRDAVDAAARATAGLRDLLDRYRIVIAVNREPADMGMWLHDGDEVALIPPGSAVV